MYHKDAGPVLPLAHRDFSVMAATIAWIYVIQPGNMLERCYKIRGRNCFAFSDLGCVKAALTHDFDAVCHAHDKLLRKSFVDMLLCMVV